MARTLGMPIYELDLLTEAEKADLNRMEKAHPCKTPKKSTTIEMSSVPTGYIPVVTTKSTHPIQQWIAAYATYLGTMMGDFDN